MNITVYPGKLNGTLSAIPSKSMAHRLLICAAFSDGPTTLLCPQTNQDIEATAECLNAIGANIHRTATGYDVLPVSRVPDSANMDCRESGSTLRFMLPIVCALGIEATIKMSGRLPVRPLSPLWEELERMGCSLARPTENTIHTAGRLKPGDYAIAGNISSQFITGLLLALPLLEGKSSIRIVGNLESKPYVDMTLQALAMFNVPIVDFTVTGSYPYHSPGSIRVEGDWSNGAFFLAASALGNAVKVTGLELASFQGDRAVADILNLCDTSPVISAADIPDLVPILAVYFAAKGGATFTNIERLRLKESDRVTSVSNLLHALGIRTDSDTHTLKVFGGNLHGGTVDACGDHRIAMAAAIASTVADGPVTILGAQCVAKSYPTFWQEFRRLGGNYEQYIR